MTPDRVAARLEALADRLATTTTRDLPAAVDDLTALRFAALAFRGAAEAPAALAAMRIGCALALEQMAVALDAGEIATAERCRITAAAMRHKASAAIETSVLAALTKGSDQV